MRGVDEKMHEDIQFTLDLAEKILSTAGEDSHDAVLRAVGTLAQVILFTIAGIGATEH